MLNICIDDTQQPTIIHEVGWCQIVPRRVESEFAMNARVETKGFHSVDVLFWFHHGRGHFAEDKTAREQMK